MARGNQLDRQWRLLQLIDRSAGVTVGDAARDLGCAVRTIWRDVIVLQRAGFPIYDDKSGDSQRTVWRVTDEFRRRLPLKLGLAEVLALLLSRDLLAAAGASVLGPDLASALDKIRGLLSADALRLLDSMRDGVGVRAAGAKLQQPPVAAPPPPPRAGGGRASPPPPPPHARAGPRAPSATIRSSATRLLAYCRLRQAVRVFALERIREATVSAERFKKPADFDPDEYLK